MRFPRFFGRFVAILFQDVELAGISLIRPRQMTCVILVFQVSCVISLGPHGERLVWNIRVQLQRMEAVLLSGRHLR
jgi:hypothetical protein